MTQWCLREAPLNRRGLLSPGCNCVDELAGMMRPHMTLADAGPRRRRGALYKEPKRCPIVQHSSGLSLKQHSGKLCEFGVERASVHRPTGNDTTDAASRVRNVTTSPG